MEAVIKLLLVVSACLCIICLFCFRLAFWPPTRERAVRTAIFHPFSISVCKAKFSRAMFLWLHTEQRHLLNKFVYESFPKSLCHIKLLACSHEWWKLTKCYLVICSCKLPTIFVEVFNAISSFLLAKHVWYWAKFLKCLVAEKSLGSCNGDLFVAIFLLMKKW